MTNRWNRCDRNLLQVAAASRPQPKSMRLDGSGTAARVSPIWYATVVLPCREGERRHKRYFGFH